MDLGDKASAAQLNSPQEFDMVPYCKVHYKQAVVSLLWAIKDNDEQRRRQLLFGSIEFVPSYLGDQFGCDEQKKIIKPYRLFFKRQVVSVEHAIELFDNAAENGTIPVPGQNDLINIIPEGIDSSTIISLPGVGKTSFNRDIPFLLGAFRFEGAQTNHLMFSERPSPLEVFVCKDNVSKWLNDRMLWRLDKNLEYVASFNLVLPNPYFSHSAIRLIPSSYAAAVESVVLKINHDCNDKNLTAIVAERANGEYGIIRHFKLIDNEIPLSLQGLGDEVEYTILDSYGRVLARNEFSNFMRSITTNINFAGRGEMIKCQDGKLQLIHRSQYRPSVVSDPILETEEYRARTKVSTIKLERELAEKAKNQHLYFNNQADAERFIRKEIINQANESVVIVDPYFSLKTVDMFIDKVVNPDVAVSVICTAKGWSQKPPPGSSEGKASYKARQYRELKSKIDSLRNRGYNISVTVVGRRQLHDRFICVDGNEVWMIGASLDKTTGSLTAIAKLANGNGFLHELMRLFENAHKTDFDKREDVRYATT